jgi:indolepyruvate ferredoxin oxidoreductase
MPASLVRPDYALADNLGAERRHRLPHRHAGADPARADAERARRAAGIASRGFISGYRGSPLGMVDQQAWKAGKRLDAAGVKFLPAINEELAATAVLGTQRVESDPERTAEGVFAMWYGKGPGVDRAGDALKHGNAYGASPHGGVLVVAGDDHGCVSSSMPHQSDAAMQSWHMPVLAPANVAEYLEFGLYGWALSRFSGNWVGFTALSEVVESGSTVDLDETNARVAAWKDGATVAAETGFVRPADGLHYRWPDLPSLKIEQRLHAKLDAVRAFAKINSIDRDIVTAPRAVGRHRHLRQGALRPARGLPPPRHPARCARRRRRSHPQDRPRLSGRADAARRVRRRPRRDPRRRGEGRPGRAAAARPVLQPRACGRR